MGVVEQKPAVGISELFKDIVSGYEPLAQKKQIPAREIMVE